MSGHFFEDFRVGDVDEFGEHVMTQEAIVAFAKQFDPQPFHIDEEAARRSTFGGIIASGWHTASVCMRMAVDRFLGPSSGSLGSPGIDELRWLKPVRPGDTLRLRIEVAEVTPSRSKPDRGAVRLRYQVLNQGGDVVMSMNGIGLFARRTPPPATPPSV